MLVYSCKLLSLANCPHRQSSTDNIVTVLKYHIKHKKILKYHSNK